MSGEAARAADVWAENEAMETCPHPEGERVRDDDGTEVCAACGGVLEVGAPPERKTPDRSGAAPPESGQGILSRIPWPPGPGVPAYTPEQVEAEVLDMVARLNSGARFQAGKEEELREAVIEFEIAYARAITAANAKTAEARKAQALLACEELFVRRQVLEQVVRTTREGMHTLRAQLTGLQTVARSVGMAAGPGWTR